MSDLHNARLENAFLRHLMTSDVAISDVEAAWDLGTAKGYFGAVTVNEDGTVRDGHCNGQVVKRYPSLLHAEEEDANEEEEDRKPPGGRAVQSPKLNQKALTGRAGEAVPGPARQTRSVELSIEIGKAYLS